MLQPVAGWRLHSRNSQPLHPLSGCDLMQCLQMRGLKTALPVLGLSSSEVSYLKMTSASPQNNSPFAVPASLQTSKEQIKRGSAELKKGIFTLGLVMVSVCRKPPGISSQAVTGYCVPVPSQRYCKLQSVHIC